MPETWRDIPRHRGYQASSEGRIRSVDRTLRDGRTAGGVILALQPDKDGYLTVKLSGKRVRVNVVVQLAFAGPPEVRHLDGDRTNNRPENLEYGSRWRNERDKKGTGKEQKDGMEGSYSPPFLPVTPPVTGGQDGS
jgi:hypothetical protein